MDSAGIIPEEDLQGQELEKGETVEEAEPEEGEERLSIFEDFLDQLDLGDLDNETRDDDDKE